MGRIFRLIPPGINSVRAREYLNTRRGEGDGRGEEEEKKDTKKGLNVEKTKEKKSFWNYISTSLFPLPFPAGQLKSKRKVE